MINVNLEKMVLPELKDTRAYQQQWYIPSADGRWFQHLLRYYNESSVHAAIINNLHRRLQKGYEKDPTFYKISLDYILFGAYNLEVLWNLNHTNIVQLNHLNVIDTRIGLEDEYGIINFYYYSNDFLKYNNRKIDILHKFSEEVHTDDHQMFYFKRYSPENIIYSKPYYFSGLKEIATSIGLSSYYANLVKNNMVANTIISTNQFMDETTAKDFEKQIKKNFTDPENAGSILILYNESKEHAPEIQNFNSQEDDLKYRFIVEKVVEQIAVAHNIPSALLGILIPGKLGSAQEIPQWEAIYDAYVVQPIKDEIEQSYKKLTALLLGGQNEIQQNG